MKQRQRLDSAIETYDDFDNLRNFYTHLEFEYIYGACNWKVNKSFELSKVVLICKNFQSFLIEYKDSFFVILPDHTWVVNKKRKKLTLKDMLGETNE